MPKNVREKELARAALKREQEKRLARRNRKLTKAAVIVAVVAVVALIAIVVLGGKDKGKTKSYIAVLDTSFGTIRISMSTATAPLAVNNFVKLAEAHKYDGVLFHRISNSLSIIQGGDVTCKTPSPSCGQGDPGYTFKDELTGNERYTQGVVAMANSGPNTTGSQFFIVTGSSATGLPPNYTIFGKLADAASLKVAQTIQSQPLQPKSETPVKPIVIKSVKILNG